MVVEIELMTLREFVSTSQSKHFSFSLPSFQGRIQGPMVMGLETHVGPETCLTPSTMTGGTSFPAGLTFLWQCGTLSH